MLIIEKLFFGVIPTLRNLNAINQALPLLLSLTLFTAIFQTLASAQQNLFTRDSMLKSLDLATELMTSKQSQSAVLITGQLLEQLEKEGDYDSPFGLKVRLVHGSALIHADTSQTALDFLLNLKETSKAKKQWEIFAETCRIIASVLEYAGRKEQSLANLREAQSAIKQYHLDSIYPHFAVRISSWHRIFGNRDSSIFYANEAIRTAPMFGKVFEEAEGHLLLGLNYANQDSEKAMAHFKAAAKLYRNIEEYSSFCGIYLNMTRLALANEKPVEAMAYLDSLLTYYPLSGGNNIEHLYLAYGSKGDAFQQLGQLDSAIFYLKKGHSLELEHLRTLNQDKIVEIDNKYNVPQKVKELEDKNLEIHLKKGQLRNSVVVIVLVALFAIGLFIGLYNHRKGMRELAAQNSLIQLQSKQLKSLDAAKSRFFANVSHELRTPLSLILGPIKTLLKEKQLNEKQTQLLQMASQSGKQLNQLVNEILDLRKLEMGKMELNLQPVELSAFFSRYTAQFESLAQRQQIDLSFETKIHPEVVANIDREKCRQILYNLLSNAFKFTPTGGEIKVKLEIVKWEIEQHTHKNSQFQISVSDSGPGIHPDDLPHVFDRFFQTSRPDKPAEGGTGIGLALCHEYAQLFDGKISVKSKLGEGSVFQVVFPVAVVESKVLAAGGPEPEEAPIVHFLKNSKNTSVPKPSGKPKPAILVVEDNPDLQDYIRLILEEKYHVLTAGNGQEALKVLQSGSPQSSLPVRQTGVRQPDDHATAGLQTEGLQTTDLILSDLMMPVMDGYQLLEKLKSGETTRHIPVIMLTARAEARDRLKALRIGVDDYLTKPFDEEELLVRIENLLKNQAARRQELPAETEPEASAATVFDSDQEWLESFEAHAQQNLASGMLAIPMLAQEFAMSESSLLRQLKRLTGLTPVKYLLEMRLDHARHLLENRAHDSVAKVADVVGYTDTRSFSRSFKQRFGKLPSDFLND